MNRLLKISIPLLLIPGLLLATGCAAEEEAFEMLPPYAETAPPPAPSEEAAAAYSGQDRLSPGGKEPGEATADRMLAKTGYLTLEVTDVAEAVDQVARLARELDGYVVSSTKHGDEDDISGYVHIRVPVHGFDEALARLRQLAIDVPYESTESEDVTEEYTDLESQLRNLEATEAQYLALLEKAETVEDILAVQRELSNVRGEIEWIKGHMQYLERTSAMALIQVDLEEAKPVGQTGWSPVETFESAVDGLVVFGVLLAGVAIWLVVFCPVWVPILVFVLRRRKAKKRALAQAG